jgi:hypothetical protein
MTRARQEKLRKFSQRVHRARGAVLSDRGSVTPLAFGFLLITLILVFISINIIHGFVERRHLILVTEAALQRASQNIDERSYYTGYVEQNTTYGGARRKTTFIPIECGAARSEFFREFQFQWMMSQISNPIEEIKDAPTMRYSQMNSPTSTKDKKSLRGSIPRIQSFSCDGKKLSATVALDVYLPFPLAIGSVNFKDFATQEVTIEVGSIWGG